MAQRQRWIAIPLAAALVGVLVHLAFSPPSLFPRDQHSCLRSSEILFSGELQGPESIAFDLQGRGPYTGLGDGRIVRWDGPQLGWTDFAFSSPSYNESCKSKGRPPVLNLAQEPVCGRPLGLRFEPDTGDLYVADAYHGLHIVGPEGGFAKPLTTEAEGVPFAFTNDVDFGEDGVVYFTDSSSKYNRRDFVLMFVGGDESGRLLSYDTKTGKTKVILKGLQFPNGIALSKDKTFLVMSETLTCRAMRYWLKGPKKGTVEVFAMLPGYPDNVRRTERGDFWIAIHAMPNVFMKLPLAFRRALLDLPIPFTKWYVMVAKKLANGMIMRLSSEGEIVEVLEDQQGKVVRLVSEVEERDGKLWLGSVIVPQIAVYSLP